MTAGDGVLVDLRSADRRMRAADSAHGDFEHLAASVMCQYLRENVMLIDDGSADAMVDVQIDNADGRTAFAEMVTDTDPDRVATYNKVREHEFRWPAPQLTLHWQVQLMPKCDFRKLDVLPDALLRLEQTGVLWPALTQVSSLSDDVREHAQCLVSLGVFAVACWHRGPLDDDSIAVFPKGIEYGREDGWDVFHKELQQLLASDNLSDVRRKLRATGAQERHVFVGLTMASHECFHWWLDYKEFELPDRPPRLPADITHLWLWCADLFGCRRVLAWFPDRGWFDPARGWR